MTIEKMTNFNGFTDSESFTQLPDTFFQALLPEIGDRAEMKVTLFFLWQAQHMEGPYRALKKADFETGKLGLTPDETAYGLKKAVQRGTILKVEQEAEALYFLNSPRGRAAAQELTPGEKPKTEELAQEQAQEGEEAVQAEPRQTETIPSTPAVERPNLFKLYEENMGPLTPMIADKLKDAEQTYSEEWVVEALEIAVRKNIRSWQYVEAILKRWKEKGEHEGKDRQDAVKGSERYTKSEFEEYLSRK